MFLHFYRLTPKIEHKSIHRCPYQIFLVEGGHLYWQLVCLCAFQPKDHKMIKPGAFQAEEKELVFDIDMTDYDEVRTCCK